MDDSDKRLIKLREGDNVLMLATSCAAGDTLRIEGREYRLAANLTLGHKLAARDIKAGDIILKFGFPIGIASAPIACGAHVHVHNMRSNYTPSYTLPEAT